MRAFYEGIIGRRWCGRPCVFVDERTRPRGFEGMLERITCFGLDTRNPRGHVPAFPDSYLPGVTVSLKAGQSTYKGLWI